MNLRRVHGFDPEVDDADEFLENKVEEHVTLFPWFHQLSKDASAALDGLPKDRSELILSELALKIHTVKDPSRYICEAATRPLQADPRFLGGGALRTAEAARRAATGPPTTQWTSTAYVGGACAACGVVATQCACSGSQCRSFSVWRVPSVGVELLHQDALVGSQVRRSATFAAVDETRPGNVGRLDRPAIRRSATGAEFATRSTAWPVLNYKGRRRSFGAYMQIVWDARNPGPTIGQTEGASKRAGITFMVLIRRKTPLWTTTRKFSRTTCRTVGCGIHSARRRGS